MNDAEDAAGLVRARAGATPADKLRLWTYSVVPLAAAAFCVVAIYWTTALSIPRIWIENSAYGHGFLILPIAAWLIWERRAVLAATAPSPWIWGAPVLFGGALLWLAAEIVSIQVVAQFAFVAMIEGIVLMLLGPKVFRAIFFPAFFLFFLVPFGDGATSSLQRGTADIAVWALRATGVPVWQDGFQIVTPEGAFVVANECAGLRFFIATLTLSVVVANLFYSSWSRRLLFLAIALALPLFANGLRAYTVILLADRIGVNFAASIDHVIYGWLFLSFVTFILLGVGWSFREAPAPHRPVSSALPLKTTKPVISLLIAVLAVVVAGSGAWGYAILSERTTGAAPRLSFPAPNLPAVAEASPTWRPDFAGADAQRLDSFDLQGHCVTRAVGFYSAQRQGAKAALDEWLLAGKEWTRISLDKSRIAPDGESILAERLVVTAGGHKRLVLAWIWVDDRYTGSPMLSKLYEIEGLFAGRRSAATIALSIPIDVDQDVGGAEKILMQFLSTQAGLGSALSRAGGAAASETSPTTAGP